MENNTTTKTMESKKQTAVEWLMEQITYDNGYGQRWVSFKEATDLNIYFQKALAMEKQQIIDAFATAVLKVNSDYIGMHEETSASIYYTSTYGQ